MLNSGAANELSEIIGSIYECALDPAHWPRTLAALRLHMNFVNASLDLFDIPTGKLRMNVMSGIDEIRLSEAPGYGSDMVAQWGGPERVCSLPLSKPLLLSTVNPKGLTRASPFYSEFDEPQGIIDVMSIGLARDAATVGSVAFGRHRDAGPIGEGDIAAVRLFVPHLKRAVTISRLLEAKAVKASTFEAVLDGITAGVMMVDASLRLVHANRAAVAALAAGEPLRLRSGAVTATNGVGAALAVAVAAAAAGAVGGRGLNVPARPGRRGVRAARAAATAMRPVDGDPAERGRRHLRRRRRGAPAGAGRRDCGTLRADADRGAGA